MKKTGVEAGEFADTAAESVATSIKKMVAGAGGVLVAVLKLALGWYCNRYCYTYCGVVETFFVIVICIFRVEYYDCFK